MNFLNFNDFSSNRYELPRNTPASFKTSFVMCISIINANKNSVKKYIISSKSEKKKLLLEEQL